MTTMTIIDVVNILYPGQQALGNVTYGQEANSTIIITSWNVPGVPKPLESDLEAQIPGLQNQFYLNYFITYGTPQLASYVDSVAQQKQYENAVSCASYINSSVVQWKNEATTFIAWRDSIYNYAIAQQTLMQSGKRTIPTFDEFKTELPVIVWP